MAFKRWAKDHLNLHRRSRLSPSSGTVHAQDSNRNDDSSATGLDGTNRDTKDEGQSSRSAVSNPLSDASSGLDGTNQVIKDEVPPWQGWEPDSNFLYELHKWNIAHKDDKLPAVLTKVNSVLESKPLQAALEFIPNNPFPAKSLVKAMVSLFLLGSKIPQTKQDIYNFSNQVVVDITRLAEVFGVTGGGQLSQKAWEDLQETRDLVNQICEWAHNGLKLRNILSAKEEMKEVKEKLNDARSKFMQIGIIRTLGALDTVMYGIEDLRKHGQIIGRLQYIKETLGHCVVPQAKYDSEEQKKREYHEDTRKGVINEIGLWTRIHSDSENCWWITGRPAVGKSTIGVQVAETFRSEKCLYAQYFVTRNIPATTDPENLIPTMALQLAEKSPLAAQVIQDKLETTPLNLVKRLSDGQAQALLLEPLRAIAQHAPRVVVVIDGVDELANTEPSVLSKVTSVLCSIVSDLPANVKILIFSRPEQWITTKIPLHIKRLDLATKDSEDDVYQLVSAKLSELAEIYEWNDWPSYNQIRLLCQLAAGHLGLAMTALRWIARQIEYEGSAWRDEVIKDVSQLGMGELDELYAFILHRVLPPQDPARKRYLKGLKTVLGCLVVVRQPLDFGTISTLLSLDNFDVLHCMKRISSLTVDGTESLTERSIPQVHKSFVDYLVSSRAHPDLLIDPTEHHHSLTTTCFKVIQNLTFNVGHIATSYNMYDTYSCISRDITYPCQWLGSHLENGGERATLVPDVEKFMKTSFLQWLEVLSLHGMMESVAVSTLEILEKQIEGKDRALTLFIGDAIEFVRKFEEPMTSNVAHIYISALPLAPSHSLVSQHYLPQYPHTLVVKAGPQTWDELREQPFGVKRACLSLDGTRIAAIFVDNTLCIYDTTTGEAVLPPFNVDENPRSVVFSPDGKLVASGGEALRLWDVQTGEEVERFDIDVYSLAFSPDGTCVAAGCKGRYADWWDSRTYHEDGSYNLRIINLDLAAKIPDFHAGVFMPSAGEGIKLLKGEVQPSPFEGHANEVKSVAYSADGKQIASSSSSYDFTVRVWDVSTGSRRTFRETCSTSSVAFSPDCTQLASDSALFNLSTGSRTPHGFGKVGLAVSSFAFSADGRYLASVGSRLGFRLWDASSHESIVEFVGHKHNLPSVAFFPDGKQIMSASQDGTIRVWDIESLEVRGEMDWWRMKWSMGENWILGPAGEHLFWSRLPFLHTRNTLVIGRCMDIDFSNFVYGDEWEKCREPL